MEAVCRGGDLRFVDVLTCSLKQDASSIAAPAGGADLPTTFALLPLSFLLRSLPISSLSAVDSYWGHPSDSPLPWQPRR